MASTGERAAPPLSVVIPTIGRSDLLDRCLSSIAACRPGPAELLVIDQSGGSVADVVSRYADIPARLIVGTGRGVAAGTNQGLREASAGHVLVTHDDCTVAADWISAAADQAAARPDAIVTGRVLPGGDPAAVPSTKADTAPADFTGLAHYGMLYPANMLLPRAAMLEFGGFDERPSLRVAAEDNDLCYRWLTSGRPLRYEPALVVTHHDWRSHRDLQRLHVAYARGQGAFYAKHLLAGDRRMLRLIAADLRRGLRSVAESARDGRPRWSDERRGILRGLPAGLAAGIRDEWSIRTAGRGRAPSR